MLDNSWGYLISPFSFPYSILFAIFCMFVGLKNVTCYVSGKKYEIKKGQEVKPGVVRVFEGIGRTEHICQLPNNYIQRQLIWTRTIQQETGEILFWHLLNKVILDYLPLDKKVGQWCVSKQNKINAACLKQFPDMIVPIKNEHVNSNYNWDGPAYHIVVDPDKVQDIVDYINYQCCLVFA